MFNFYQQTLKKMQAEDVCSFPGHPDLKQAHRNYINCNNVWPIA